MRRSLSFFSAPCMPICSLWHSCGLRSMQCSLLSALARHVAAFPVCSLFSTSSASLERVFAKWIEIARLGVDLR